MAAQAALIDATQEMLDFCSKHNIVTDIEAACWVGSVACSLLKLDKAKSIIKR